MRLRRIERKTLNPDYSNLDDLVLPDLMGYLAGSKGEEIRAKLEEMALTTARKGDGVAADTIPQPYAQSGLECQTMALINGIHSVGASSLLQGRDIDALVKMVRARAVAEGHSEYAMIWIEQYFPDEGIPLGSSDAPLNPVKLAEALFQKGRFVGIVETARWHATTWVPLANPTKDAFVMGLDSLGGRKKVISIAEYVGKILSWTIEDSYRLYQTTPK